MLLSPFGLSRMSKYQENQRIVKEQVLRDRPQDQGMEAEENSELAHHLHLLSRGELAYSQSCSSRISPG
jgi:hypothetical protein